MYTFFFQKHRPKWIVLSLLLISFQVTAATIKIQPLGDSITYGPGLVPVVSYRYPLFKLLVTAGIDAQFVGTLIDQASYPAVNGKTMSPNHEGHWGYRIDQVNSELPGYLNSYTPDWSLIYLGTNNGRDGVAASQVYNQMSTTIDLLRAKNSKIVIFLVLISPNQGLFTEYNTQYTNLARTKTTAASPIITVGPPVGWNPSVHTSDGTHPNVAGADLLASTFLKAFQTYLGSTDINVPQVKNKEAPNQITVTKTGRTYNIDLPVQEASVDIIGIDGKRLLSTKVMRGQLTLPANIFGSGFFFLRVKGQGYSATVPLKN